ncbi:hypothetical protein ACSBR1_033339 [Camellia fascicularis]
MASSSTNNSNIRLKPRICDCERTAAMYIVRTNENGNQGHLFFVCPSKYISTKLYSMSSNKNKAHCNYYKFADDDDKDVTSIIRPNTGPHQSLTTEELYELRAIVSEMENQIHRRLQRIENKMKAMIYVIVFCMILFLMK